jgi:nucleoid DNA-binding protein
MHSEEFDTPEAAASNSLTKRKLVVRIAAETGMRQEDVFDVLQRSLDYISESLQQGKHVEFRDFGVFEVIQRKSRVGRNPNKPSHVVQIPQRTVVKFKPGRKMKQLTEDAPLES